MAKGKRGRELRPKHNGEADFTGVPGLAGIWHARYPVIVLKVNHTKGKVHVQLVNWGNASNKRWIDQDKVFSCRQVQSGAVWKPGDHVQVKWVDSTYPETKVDIWYEARVIKVGSNGNMLVQWASSLYLNEDGHAWKGQEWVPVKNVRSAHDKVMVLPSQEPQKKKSKRKPVKKKKKTRNSVDRDVGDDVDCVYCIKAGRNRANQESKACDGCGLLFHPCCAGYEEDLREDPMYRGSRIALYAYCSVCLKRLAISQQDIIDQQNEYRDLEKYFSNHSEEWSWIPVAQDGYCSLGGIWKWLEEVHLGVNPFASFNEFVRACARATREVLSSSRGQETRARIVAFTKTLKLLERSPEKLCDVWRDFPVDYAWSALVDRVLPNVAIHLWVLRHGKLEARRYPDDMGHRTEVHVLQWNVNVAAHFDLLLSNKDFLPVLNECDLDEASLDSLFQSPLIQGVVLNLNTQTWAKLEQQVLKESGDTQHAIAVQGKVDGIPHMSADELVHRLKDDPSLPLYLRDLPVEQLRDTHALWRKTFDPVMGVDSAHRNLLKQLHTNDCGADLPYHDTRECRYLNVYYYVGGEKTFCALHRDTLATCAGNVVLQGFKLWIFVWAKSKERLFKVLGGEHRLGREASVPDLEWLQSQEGIYTFSISLKPGQLMMVNSQAAHMVTNVGPGPTTSMAWNVLPPYFLQRSWEQMHRNRALGIESKILLQELVFRAHLQKICPERTNPCLADLFDAQKHVLESTVFQERTQLDALEGEFLWCDLCKGEVWNASIECTTCEGMAICAYCFRDAPHSKHHDMSLTFVLDISQLVKRLK